VSEVHLKVDYGMPRPACTFPAKVFIECGRPGGLLGTLAEGRACSRYFWLFL
jgi:hypothetical protein